MGLIIIASCYYVTFFLFQASSWFAEDAQRNLYYANKIIRTIVGNRAGALNTKIQAQANDESGLVTFENT